MSLEQAGGSGVSATPGFTKQCTSLEALKLMTVKPARERERRDTKTAPGHDNGSVVIHVDVYGACHCAQAKPNTHVEVPEEDRTEEGKVCGCLVGFGDGSKQGFRVEDTSTHSFREWKRDPSTTVFFVACCTILFCMQRQGVWVLVPGDVRNEASGVSVAGRVGKGDARSDHESRSIVAVCVTSK